MEPDYNYNTTRTAQPPAMQVRKSTHADNVREEAERLHSRLSAVRGGLANLRDRISGSRPEEGAEGTRDMLASGGFIGGVGSAIQRAHVEVTMMENLLAELSEVI